MSNDHRPTRRCLVQSIDAMDWVILAMIGIEVLAHKLHVAVYLKGTEGWQRYSIPTILQVLIQCIRTVVH